MMPHSKIQIPLLSPDQFHPPSPGFGECLLRVLQNRVGFTTRLFLDRWTIIDTLSKISELN
jgi:hypothetical protein